MALWPAVWGIRRRDSTPPLGAARGIMPGGAMSAVGGGGSNRADADGAVVAGGVQNGVSGYYGSVACGYSNSILGHYGAIAGGFDNEIIGEYGFIGGGGRSNPQNPATLNRVTDDYGVIGGGGNNQAGDKDADTTDATYATVAGGQSNQATAAFATVAGGYGNQAGGHASFVGAGLDNVTVNDQSVVAGGRNNKALGARSTVAGGDGNEAQGFAFVGGGDSNLARQLFATVAGGCSNLADGQYSTISGGYNNLALADYATIAGGGCVTPGDQRTCNRVTDRFGVIGGGGANEVGNANAISTDAPYATVSGGLSNVASEQYSAVGGGFDNEATDDGAVVAGGVGNHALGLNAVVAGGNDNYARGERAAVGGGRLNEANGGFATIPGGYGNVASGLYSFAAGYQAKANNPGCFVWADNSTLTPVLCGNDYRWVARASGGVYFYTTPGMTAGVRVPAGGGAWSSISDRNVKENFTPAGAADILARVATLSVSTWNYKTQTAEIRHIGPTAQDFYAAFGLGEDEQFISTVDADGVALAAIQGLYQLAQEQGAQINQLQADNARLEAQLAAQQEQIAAVDARLEGGEPNTGAIPLSPGLVSGRRRIAGRRLGRAAAVPVGPALKVDIRKRPSRKTRWALRRILQCQARRFLSGRRLSPARCDLSG